MMKWIALLLSITTVNGQASQLKQIIESHFPNQVRRFIYDDGQGRIDLQGGSFYVFTPSGEIDSSITYLIPLATSRSDQAAKPPIVYKIAGRPANFSSEPLSEFLLREIFRKRAKNGMLDLYRGAEREDERESWTQGVPAPGARYWTPTIDYAWRYARKQAHFLSQTIAGKSPILHFQVAVDEFERQVRQGRLILGAELPARIHKRLESGQGFTDHLAAGDLYLGYPDWGMEVEILSGRERSLFTRGFKGSITWAEMVASRKQQIQVAYERAYHQWPLRRNRLQIERDRRLNQVAAEVGHTDFESWHQFKCQLELLETEAID